MNRACDWSWWSKSQSINVDLIHCCHRVRFIVFCKSAVVTFDDIGKHRLIWLKMDLKWWFYFEKWIILEKRSFWIMDHFRKNGSFWKMDHFEKWIFLKNISFWKKVILTNGSFWKWILLTMVHFEDRSFWKWIIFQKDSFNKIIHFRNDQSSKWSIVKRIHFQKDPFFKMTFFKMIYFIKWIVLKMDHFEKWIIWVTDLGKCNFFFIQRSAMDESLAKKINLTNDMTWFSFSSLETINHIVNSNFKHTGFSQCWTWSSDEKFRHEKICIATKVWVFHCVCRSTAPHVGRSPVRNRIQTIGQQWVG